MLKPAPHYDFHNVFDIMLYIIKYFIIEFRCVISQQLKNTGQKIDEKTSVVLSKESNKKG